MRRCTINHFVFLAALLCSLSFSSTAQNLQLVSALDPSQAPPAGGNGDSWGPIMSRDGRYVLFASTANNLMLTTNNSPIPAPFPASLNVFFRDRTNGTTSLVSVNVSGIAGGNADSLPIDISTNGQYVLFESTASDLVAGDTNNASDVFLRDMVAGATVLVSLSTNGVAGNGASRSSAMTLDGRHVAFVSAANNLVAGDTNGIPDVFVRDLQNSTTILASIGAQSVSGTSEAPYITPDGRYVAFYSTATNLVPGVPAGGDIYVRDRVGGTTVWASTGARAAAQAALGKTNIACFNHILSADGQFVAYEASPSLATVGLILRYNLGTGLTDVIHTNAAVDGLTYEDIRSLDMTPDGRYIAFLANTNDTSGETTCIDVWDAQSGAITLASGDLSGSVAPFSICEWPVLNPSGRFVAFLSSAVGLVTNDTPGDFHLYLRDLQTGTTALVDADTNGVGSPIGADAPPSMSTDGRFVAFDCADSSIVANDRNHDSDAFVRDLATGVTELSSAHDPALPSLTPNGISILATTSVSGDGRLIAFASEADNLIPNDTNGVRDIFVRDLLNGTNLLVSANTNGLPSNGTSSEPAISPDGRYVAFSSNANDLVPGDNNNAQDVFVRDLQTGTTTLVSVNSTGTGPGNKSSSSPLISSGGRFVLFYSNAGLTAVFTLGQNLFLRDTQASTTYALTARGVTTAAMTPDGHFVAFVGTPPLLATSALYVWDSQAAANIYTNSTLVIGPIALSPDGKWLLYWTSTGLYATDLANSTNLLITANGPSSQQPGLRFSSNGRFLSYSAAVAQVGSPSTNQVFLFDFQAGSNFLVSQTWGTGAAANGNSDSPDIDSSGRFIAYRSQADNIVPGDIHGVPNIFLYDTQNATNVLLSVNRFGLAPDNRSLTPVFSGNGRRLLFESWAADLVAQDFNQSADVFAYNFLYADILIGGSPGTLISWPSNAGNTYRVQFKDNLNGTDWLDLTGTITNTGNKAWIEDPTPTRQRFYRIVTF